MSKTGYMRYNIDTCKLDYLSHDDYNRKKKGVPTCKNDLLLWVFPGGHPFKY